MGQTVSERKIGASLKKIKGDLRMTLKITLKVKYKVTKWWLPMISTTFVEVILLISHYLDEIFRPIHTFATPGIEKWFR